LAALPASASAAESAVKFEHETKQAYEQQLAGGQVKEATFNKRVRSVHLTLTDGRHVLYKYPPKAEPGIAAALQARHVPVTVLTPTQAATEAKKAPVHHKLRYIAGGIVIAVIIIVGAVLLFDRRRKLAME
jgi:hypothetical protein